MNIIKGIIAISPDNKLIVHGVGAIYNLPPQYNAINFNINDKVFGVIIDNKFEIIYEFKLKNGNVHYGYYYEVGIPEDFSIIPIENFNKIKNDIHFTEVELSNPIKIKGKDIDYIRIAK